MDFISFLDLDVITEAKIYLLGWTTFFSVGIWTIVNIRKVGAWRLRCQEKKRLKKLAKRFPDTAAKLNPDTIKEQNAMEQEQRDREEFERIVREHPDWL